MGNDFFDSFFDLFVRKGGEKRISATKRERVSCLCFSAPNDAIEVQFDHRRPPWTWFYARRGT